MMKARINRPRPDITEATYQAECRFALEPSFLGLASKAAEAGWAPKEIAYALMVLSAEALQTLAPPGETLHN